MTEALRKVHALLTPGERRATLRCLLLNLLSAPLGLLSILSIMPFLALVMDPTLHEQRSYFKQAYEALGFASVSAFQVFVGFVSFGVLLVTNSYSLLLSLTNRRFMEGIHQSLAADIYTKALAQPYGDFFGFDRDQCRNQILNQCESVATNWVLGLVKLVTTVLSIFLIVAALVSSNPLLGVAVLAAFTLFYLLIYLSVRGRLRELGKRNSVLGGVRLRMVTEPFQVLRDVKLRQKEAEFVARFRAVNAEFAINRVKNTLLGEVPRYAVETFAFGVIILTTVWLVYSAGGASEAIPVIGLYAFASNRLAPWIRAVFSSMSAMRYGQANLDVIHEVITRQGGRGATSLPAQSAAPRLLVRQIEMRDVTFRYAGTIKPVLQDVNLIVKPRTTVGIVGPSGVGKSTLADLLVGMLQPSSGTVEIDGKSLVDTTSGSWFRSVGYVSQDATLVNDTVENNVAFTFQGPIDRAAVERAARTAKIHDFIMTLPQGYQSQVGERGIKLSGGQRQRLAIARALYLDPEVLIFDEATNALDVETERSFFEAIASLTNKKTIILITHRIESAARCDQILAMTTAGRVKAVTVEELRSSSF